MLSTRIAFYYFTYFAGLGVVLPWFNLYFERLGMGGIQIGILAAIVPLGKAVFPTLWAYHADRYGRRRGLTIVACVLSVGAFGSFLFVDTFTGLVMVSLGLAMVDGPRLPMVEATSLDLARQGGIDYGRTRSWGSVGFILSSAGLGILVSPGPIRIVLYAALGWSLLGTVAAFLLPPMPMEPVHRRTSLRAFVRTPAVVAFFTGCVLMQASHGAYYAFFSIHLEHLGYRGTAIGALWALGVMAEVVVMSTTGRLAGRFSPSAVMILCMLVAAARWSMTAASGSPFVLVPAQLLHAFTFGAFHVAAVTQTHRLFPADLRASGQSLFGGLTYGLGTVLGAFGSGVLFDLLGPWKMFSSSVLVALAAAGSLTLFRLVSDNKSHERQPEEGGDPETV